MHKNFGTVAPTTTPPTPTVKPGGGDITWTFTGLTSGVRYEAYGMLTYVSNAPGGGTGGSAYSARPSTLAK